ncbi:stationary phase inducible protein CsiE [Leclercia sp. 29361]|jgi:transcriptional antiterminator|uniref:Stationary phase inducible protein CsiE n=1 Tax=Leclercia tamurae TaxID=2926467 RepID=A0ABT2RDH1_9ENTR|nr:MULTISPECIES: stationary phase inducible protein CsiE [Leclercia]MCT9846291.1 stationary phase inducible protein CsiE [Leclercia adecarboxylata ATCC 23216 = NBRC 102595]MCU6678939.1 stationary phase inducible protein CsiE [Leclercia tamurae]MDY0922553.1 stationary phase inducible protein CsiE [Leclercia sp. CFBP8987]QIK15020.1 stationary phase inducible protein CsiE [Leclercia sp. 29361]
MMTTLEMPSALSSSQRRCQVLLMLYVPGFRANLQRIGEINGVDDALCRQDIDEMRMEIQRYHQLDIATQHDGCYLLEGSHLNQRLCLLHWLRRALRLCPHFVAQQFTPSLKIALKQLGIARTLYDDTNLRALINFCSRRLQRQFESRDTQFLQLYLQYCLLQHHLGQSPEFSVIQRNWTQSRNEYLMAQEIVRHWQRRVALVPHADEQPFLALLFMMLRTPDPLRDAHQEDDRLRRTITRMIARFHGQTGMQFSDEKGLTDQLYVHISQALDRSLFGIGIDNSLPEEIHRLYPRLMRTTREVLFELESEFGLRFSEEESSLVAVIFGAWLMQESDLHEKQVVLLTGEDKACEELIEQQLRELTLLPLNIRYVTLQAFQKEGAPREAALVVTPYTTALPLFSPPLIHAVEALNAQQQEHIRAMLES